MAPALLDRQAHRVDRGVDDQLAVGVHLARLLEEAEGEAGGDAEAGVAVAPAPGRGAAVGRDLRGRRADLQEEAALVGGLAGAQIFHLDGVGGHALLVVVDLDLHEVRAAHLRPHRQAARHGEAAQAEIAHHARDEHEREEHAEQEVEQVVAGVDRREAHAEGDAQVVLALAGDLELARGAEEAADLLPEGARFRGREARGRGREARREGDARGRGRARRRRLDRPLAAVARRDGRGVRGRRGGALHRGGRGERVRRRGDGRGGRTGVAARRLHRRAAAREATGTRATRSRIAASHSSRLGM